MKGAWFLAVCAFFSGCTGVPADCDAPPRQRAQKAVEACLRGGGSCSLDMQVKNKNLVGQVDLEHYRGCYPSLVLAAERRGRDRIEYIFRCSGPVYAAELRVSVLDQPIKFFGCVVTHINFFPSDVSVPIGDATTENIALGG